MHHTAMADTIRLPWKPRLRASGIHLGASFAVAVVASLLVFGLWYPYPYRETSQGLGVFLTAAAAAAVLGPLITLTAFRTKKQGDELLRDWLAVVLLQLAILAYGLWTVGVARPVHLVYEFDQFRVVHAIDIPDDLKRQAPQDMRVKPLLGPTLLAVRPFKDVKEEEAASLGAAQGISRASRPDLWENYEQAQIRVLYAAKPVAELKQRFPQQATAIDAAVHQAGQAEATLLFLPMVDRKSLWTVLLDNKTAEVKGFVPLDSF